MILKFDRTSGSVQDLIEVIKCKSVEYELLHKCIIIIIIISVTSSASGEFHPAAPTDGRGEGGASEVHSERRPLSLCGGH